MLCFLLICPSVVHADIQMTEIYPAPAGGYEWIELCNNSDSLIQSSELSLYDSAGNTLFIPSQIINPGEYLIATASSVLNNAGDTVFLERLDNLIQTATYSERINHEQSYVLCDGLWTITDITSPGTANPVCQTPTRLVQPSLEPSKTPTSTIHITPTDTLELLPTFPVSPQVFRTKHSILGHMNTSITPTLKPTRQPIPTIEVETHSQKMLKLGVWIAIAVSSIPAVYYGSVLYKNYQSRYNEEIHNEHKEHPT